MDDEYEWEFIEDRPPPIELVGDTWGPGAAGAFSDTLGMTHDPRHPRCYGCGRFLRVGAHCQDCGCDCSKCVPWAYR